MFTLCSPNRIVLKITFSGHSETVSIVRGLDLQTDINVISKLVNSQDHIFKQYFSDIRFLRFQLQAYQLGYLCKVHECGLERGPVFHFVHLYFGFLGPYLSPKRRKVQSQNTSVRDVNTSKNLRLITQRNTWYHISLMEICDAHQA